MDRVPAWKPLLVVATVVLGVLAIWFPGAYGPAQRLKPGLDLAGGTTLIYQVHVPPEQSGNAKSIVEDVISVLRARVDPQGVRNLIWRPQAGNRIEIQMPLPPVHTRKLRQEFIRVRDQLLAANLSPSRLSSALRLAADERRSALEQLAAGNAELQAQLIELAQAHDELAEAEAAYQPVEQAKQQAEQQLKALAAEASEAARQTAQAEFERLLNEAQAKAAARNKAAKNYAAAEKAVLEANVDPGELERALALYHRGAKGAALEPYRKAVETLMERHPGRQPQIQAVATAWEKYAQVKDWLDDPNDLIAMLKGSGILEFRVAVPASQIPDLDSYRQQLEERGPRYGVNRDYRWFPVDDLSQFVNDDERLEQLRKNPEQWPAYFLQTFGIAGQAYAEQVYVLLGNTPQTSVTRAEPDWKLTTAWRGQDDTGLPAVHFTLNARGGQLMAALSGQHIGQGLAILLDGRVISAPTIQEPLGASIRITRRGGFSPTELDYMVRTLKAGAIEGSLSEQPISIQTTGPQLGQDNLRHGLNAAVWALILVSGFMIAYYLFAGTVAVFALTLNILLILASMAVFQGTFTLGGIAGIILTMGMAVDANVLIYERIREELQRKTEMKTAIRLGFERAFVTILDSNVTTIITAVVLYYTATADIKGFALTLIIGLLANLYAAVFCTRVVFDLWAQWTGAKNLPMLPTVVPAIQRALSPSINWYGLRRVFITASLVLIAVGFVAIYSRGQDMLDIEFRSGTRVTFALAKGQTMALAEARERVNKALPNQINTVTSIGAAQDGHFSEFAVQTLETDAANVSSAIKRAFADVLSIQQPIHFAAMGDPEAEAAPPVATPPVYPVDQRWLGPVIGRPDVQYDAGDYLGGVAIVLQGLDPATTTEDIAQRIHRVTQSPQYANLPFRQFHVMGLDLAPASSDRYQSVVVLARDLETNYTQQAALSRFTEVGGLAQTQWSLVRDALLRDTSLGSVTNFDSQVSTTMQTRASEALILGNLAVMAYIWLRFGSLRYGTAAVLALVHDVCVALGMVALSAWFAESTVGRALGIYPFRIDLTMVAAMLTLVGFSVNDTIVIFDRIRENRGKLATATPAIINDSINQTISRTILTSTTAVMSAIVLYVLGGPAIRGFAYAMTVGMIVGCYSTIAIASPLLLVKTSTWVRSCGIVSLLAGGASVYGGLARLGLIRGGAAQPKSVATWLLLVVGGLLVVAAVRMLWIARRMSQSRQPVQAPAQAAAVRH